jgi:hypothetical protein
MRLALQLLEVELARVVEGHARDADQHLLDGPFRMLRLLQLVVLGENLRLALVEDAVEATENGQRQDDLAVVGLLVVSAKKIRDRPEEACDLREAVEAPRRRRRNRILRCPVVFRS